MRNTAPSSTRAGIFFFIAWSLAAFELIDAFSLTTTSSVSSRCRWLQSQSQPLYTSKKIINRAATAAAAAATEVDDCWTSLTDNGAVKLKVISSSSTTTATPAPTDDDATDGKLNLKGKDVTVEYIGTITPRNWSAQDVIECWLPDQGLSSLAPELFEAFDINYTRLTNDKKFTTKFIKEGLGIMKDAKQTTLFEAAQDLKRSEATHRKGTVFDKNQFTFRPNRGQVIPAFDLAVAEMEVGQTVSLVVRCDYAYGSRGLRVGGKVLVPPYATVQYDVTLIEVK